ncbi:MAG: PDZ domain-containing protein, partial [Clostridia bacterium]|nr:PDZ domain-containing protein [Clostridia bacterium]
MKRRFSWITLLCTCIICSVLTFALTIFAYQQVVNTALLDVNDMQQRYGKLIKLDKLVREIYVHEIDEEALMDGILTGYMDGLGDLHSFYMPKDLYEDNWNMLSGSFVGIGITAVQDVETLLIRVVEVFDDSPAASVGLQTGDLIEAVEGTPVTEMGYEAAVEAIPGEEGTVVNLTVRRGEQQLTVSPTRARVEVPTVSHEILDSGLGLLRITEFDLTTPDQFYPALDALIAAKVPGIIFDLRDNSGGELNAVCDMLDRLVPEGTIIE